MRYTASTQYLTTACASALRPLLITTVILHSMLKVSVILHSCGRYTSGDNPDPIAFYSHKPFLENPGSPQRLGNVKGFSFPYELLLRWYTSRSIAGRVFTQVDPSLSMTLGLRSISQRKYYLLLYFNSFSTCSVAGNAIRSCS